MATTPEPPALYDICARLDGAGAGTAMLQMFETTQRIVLSALDPALGDHQRRRELCRRLYGDALALSAFSDAEHGATVPTFRSVLPGPSKDLVS